MVEFCNFSTHVIKAAYCFVSFLLFASLEFVLLAFIANILKTKQLVRRNVVKH